MHAVSHIGLAAIALAIFATYLPAADDALARSLAAIKSVGHEGNGNAAAGPAWKAVVGAGEAALIPTLQAMKDADATASNWLRTAVDAIAEGEAKAGRKLPAEKLETFVKDTTQGAAARRIAYELLVKDDPQSSDRLLGGFVDDPSLELRRDAIALGIKHVENSGDGKAKSYRRLFTAARDKDQVEELARGLEKIGEKPSVTEHYGYVTHWRLIGPFDSTEGKGFNVAYPPETKVDLKATYRGKDEKAMAAWVPYVTRDRYATVDLNTGIGKHHDAAAYAFASINTEKEQPVEIRIASQNAVQIFLNGKRLFQREEYHHGTRMDQHIGRGTLKAGANELLLKVCQNNQDQNWAQAWGFQCRLCDFTGGGLPLTQADADGKPVKLGFTPNPLVEPKEKKK